MKKFMVNGLPVSVQVYDHFGCKSAPARTRGLFERMVKALNDAGFKYVHAYGRFGLLTVDTVYGGMKVKFVVAAVKGGLEGHVLLPEFRTRTAGIILVKCNKVNVLIDVFDDIPSMTLDL